MVLNPLEDRYRWRDGLNGATVREGVLRVIQVPKEPLRFNSGPTFRHALEDLMDFIKEHPEVWDKL
jgi:hypothetical protein